MSLRLRQLTRFPTLSLILITGFGVAGGLYILARKTFFVPEMCWDKNQESWNNLGPSDKLFAMSVDSKDLKKDRPDC